MRPSQYLPLPSRIYPHFQRIYMCDPPRIYPSLPQYTPSPSFQQLYPSQNIPSFSTTVYVRPSQNLPHPPTQNIPPFSTTVCDPPRIYPPSQNIPPFLTTIILCDPPRIYPSLPEYTPLFNQFICATLPDLHLSPRIFFSFGSEW